MRYINEQNPNIRVLVRRGPELAKGQNPNTRQDEFVQFRYGLAETDDPEAIAVLDARPDCIREEDRGKIAGYIREAEIEAEVNRRLEERLQQAESPAHESRQVQAAPLPRRMSGKQKIKCPECGKECGTRLAYQNHMKTHKKIAATEAVAAAG